MAKFKARARTLDLLGRQQIAGIPTAINELFKNAHDAYADHVEVDYFRKEKILVLRDDGLGMTKKDFETRWLTLGTESKFTNRKTPPPPVDPDKNSRPIMGEKGIGRLAIASIGSQMLILTRAKRPGESHKIVAAFINWNIFELPGLNLDDIVIPVREFTELPSYEQIKLMQDEIAVSLMPLVENDDLTEKEYNALIDGIYSFKCSPRDLETATVSAITLMDGKCGTHFFISPINESLNYDIDGDRDDKSSSKIEKMLVGFTNTMTPKHPKPQIEATFRDYKGNDGTYTSIIDKDQFFTPEDFQLADHHFSGNFDEFGQFSGKVQVYRGSDELHKINWAGNNYKPTLCGPFHINVAYFQGAQRQSIMDKENHARLYAKAEKFGGLYIYKDNIRILPYGNPDIDWLDIEKNRSKSASFYFFNSRRMFGVLDISKDLNSNLKEKAGREGFIENKAYNQIRDILKNFFTQLAADFFREGSGAGPKAEIWVKKRAEREAFFRALEKRDQQSKVRKERFQSDLNKFFENRDKNQYASDINEIFHTAKRRFENVAYIEDPEEAAQALIDAESKARQDISEYRNKLKISTPRGFTISKETRQDFEVYTEEYAKIESNLISKTGDEIDVLVDDLTNRLHIEISKRKRLEQAVDFISIEAKKATSKKQREAKDAVSEITGKVKDLASDLMIGLENKIRDVKDQFKNLNMTDSADFNLVTERKRVEDEISDERDKATRVLESIIQQLHGIYWSTDQDSNVITSDQINDAMSEELEDLRERIHADIELSQLGLAVGVIHHEFNSSINSIRGSLKDLKAWADVNDKLDGVYNNIRINFEHLDSYLNLFTPLNRRLNRNKEEIPSMDIKIFLLDLFKPRFERHNIQLLNTKGFTNRKLFGFRSTFYPVFVNVIDNAIYWLKQKSDEGDRIIRLHADDTGFYISNNGPAISITDAERIFDLGFTRKRNGRGMGLHISKEVLEVENYHIFVDAPREGSSVTFKIEKIKGTDEN